MSTIIQSSKRPAADQPPTPGQTVRAPQPTQLSNRQRFVEACHCRPVDRPPVWLMRQAGRALPEYRALKEKHTFLELVQTPELAAEVTLQPVRRFGFDAAILFSDILVLAEGLGQPYQFRERGGIEMDFLLSCPADIERLEVERVTERLQYVAKALPLIRTELGAQTALIGFAGSPWTLANFMIQGGGVKEYTKAKAWFYADPKSFARLMEKLTQAVTSFLQLQISCGVDAVQIFDSLGGALSDGSFWPGSGIWMNQVVEALGAGRAASPLPAGAQRTARPTSQVPVIVFSKGVHGNWADLVATGAQVLGVDWNASLAAVGAALPSSTGVQGNLDPFLLTTTPDVVAAETKRILREMKGRSGHILNLGHGVPPDARLENIATLVETVRDFSQ